ncbi:MAG: helix-turn-helix domain-containing protein [Deltaproteobacteria bacterium]|nr:helix-turn-helix domain-containing protein [Deltaproteobacteria bacterium]
MPGTKPTKTELARMKAMHDLGLSPTAIAKKIGRSHNTVSKYLRSEVYNDPQISQLVERIKEKEVQDLYLLGGKARARLHELLDEGNTKVIETVALMDRSFQQRRLLEGNSTANIGLLSALVEAAHRRDKAEVKDQKGEGSGGK